MVALHSLEAETMLAEQELDRISRRSLRNRADKAMLERAQIRVRQLRAKRAAEKKAKP